MSSLSSSTCLFPLSSAGPVVTTFCPPTLATSASRTTPTFTTIRAASPSSVDPVDLPSNTRPSAAPSQPSTSSPADNQDLSTTDTVSFTPSSTSAVPATTSISEPSSVPTAIASPVSHPPVGIEDPSTTTAGTSIISATPLPSESPSEAESPETTSISLTTSLSTVSSSSPVQAPTTATQETSQNQGSVSTTASTGPTRPPVNNAPAPPSETQVDDPPTTSAPNSPPATSPGASSPGMSTTLPPSSTTTTRRPPAQGSGETPSGPSTTTTSEGSSTTTNAAPTSPPDAGTTTRTSNPATGSTTTRNSNPPPTASEAPGVGTTPRASTTITSVTTVRSQTGTQPTTSTTLTLTPISTFSSPVQVVVTNTDDGSVSTTIPPYLTVTETRTEADGSIATETHIVANPPGALERGSADENRGLLSRTGAAAGIFATVGVLITAAIFIGYLLWRRRRQANMRKQWIQGMRQQRPDSFDGYPFNAPSIAGGGLAAGSSGAGGNAEGHVRTVSGQLRKAPPPPPPGLLGGSDDELPWAESRRIPEQRAEMRMRPVQPVTQPTPPMDAPGYPTLEKEAQGTRTSLAGVGTVKYHYERQSGEHSAPPSLTHSRSQSRDVANSIIPGPPPPPSSFAYNAPAISPTSSTGSNRNPFTGSALGLKRTGSGSTSESSTNGTWLNRSGKGKSNSGSGSGSTGTREARRSVSKEKISLPMPFNYNAANVPQPVPSPVRKPAVYDPEELFTNRLPTSRHISANSITKSSAPVPITPPANSNWVTRQAMAKDHGPSPAPSTPSMYPPTLPADDELDDSSDADLDSDGTFDKLVNKPVGAGPLSGDSPNRYSGVDGYGAFQNLFTLGSGATQRPKQAPPAPPPPPRAANRSVPSLIIDTSIQSRARSNSLNSASGSTSATQTAGPAPPRPPRSILRTSNGSLSLGPGPAKVRVQGAAEIFPLTPPASTPSHSPHSSYTLPGSPTSIFGPFAGNKQGPTANGKVSEEKVQEILSGRRLLLDRRLSERGSSGSD